LQKPVRPPDPQKVTFFDPHWSKSTGVFVGNGIFNRTIYEVDFGGRNLDRFCKKWTIFKKFIKWGVRGPDVEKWWIYIILDPPMVWDNFNLKMSFMGVNFNVNFYRFLSIEFDHFISIIFWHNFGIILNQFLAPIFQHFLTVTFRLLELTSLNLSVHFWVIIYIF
jgi:hypothetical protein